MGKGNEMVWKQHQQGKRPGDCRINRRGIADWQWSLVNTQLYCTYAVVVCSALIYSSFHLPLSINTCQGLILCFVAHFKVLHKSRYCAAGLNRWTCIILDEFLSLTHYFGDHKSTVFPFNRVKYIWIRTVWFTMSIRYWCEATKQIMRAFSANWGLKERSCKYCILLKQKGTPSMFVGTKDIVWWMFQIHQVLDVFHRGPCEHH